MLRSLCLLVLGLASGTACSVLVMNDLPRDALAVLGVALLAVIAVYLEALYFMISKHLD